MRKKQSIFSVIPKALVFGLIIGIGFYFLSPLLGFENYRAQAKILTTDEENIEKQDKTSYTYAETVNSDAVKNKVIENLKLDIEPAELDQKLDIKTVANTHIININVKDNIKLRAEDIADEYADITVGVINNLYSANARVLDYAYQNGSSLKPSVNMATRAGLAGFVTYFIFAALGLFIRNSRIEDEQPKEKIARKVAFEEEPEDIEEFTDINKKKEVSENHEDISQKNYEDTGQTEDFTEDFRYINQEDKKEVKTTRIFENEGKEYKVLSDLPKYNEDDLDV